MKVSTAAVALGASPRSVRRLIAAGQLPGAIRLGRRVLHVPARAVFDHLATSARRETAGVA